jgi:zinc protease
MKNKVIKKILKNGLTVLVRQTTNIPKVSVQLWYNVGSKDEQANEKGIAHLIEHMIFKGTKKMSESDLDTITHKLSGYCNAFTSYDYTGYLFDFPSQHWQEALPILSDCMRNCTFKEELLNSELKAVIQELKMYKDNYASCLIEKMTASIFKGHPYQHPIIGYKQDLWNLNRDNLINFYNKHYTPNNATLIIVGDIDVEEAFKLAQENFESIEPNKNYKKETFILERDLSNTNTNLLRDIKQTEGLAAWIIPGATKDYDYSLDVLAHVLAGGNDSRLYKRLVNKEKLATQVEAFCYDLFDHDIFFIHFEPTSSDNIQKTFEIIAEEVDAIKRTITEQEIKIASKNIESTYLNILENTQKQAYLIGKFYLSKQDENYIFNYLNQDSDKIKDKILELSTKFITPNLMHTGKILPLHEEDKSIWQDLQKESDELDNKILSKKERSSDIENPKIADSIKIKAPKEFNFPKYESFKLENGLEILFYENKNIPKVSLILELKAKYYYDEIPGLGNFVSEMLLEGTKNYNAEELANKIESLGINIKTSPGFITMDFLSEDFEQALKILSEILTQSTFEKNSIEKIKTRLKSEIQSYWDNPSEFSDQLIRDKIYKGHPYSKNLLGTIDSINKITRDDLIQYFEKYISPDNAKLAISGDFKNKNIKQIIENELNCWSGKMISDLEFPNLISIDNTEQELFKIDRDQVVLAYSGHSINRTHPDYDKLLIFDQVFGGGSLGAMSSRLFKIRERSGLFYTISGSLISRANLQPGMSIVKTIVSLDRLNEAEKLIENEIQIAAENMSDEEFIKAKNAIINSQVDNFSSNRQIANVFLFLNKYNLDNNYFDKRALNIENIKKTDTLKAASQILDSPMVKFKIGRI